MDLNSGPINDSTPKHFFFCQNISVSEFFTQGLFTLPLNLVKARRPPASGKPAAAQTAVPAPTGPSSVS